MSTVLFVCLHNAGRSQMSQALFESAAGGRHTALSAGTTPAEHIHPAVLEVMTELGIDLSDRTPQLLTRELAEQADLVITMGCGDQCPYIPGKRYLDWELPDPAGRPLDDVRTIRDELAKRVTSLIEELDARSAEPPASPHNELPLAPSGCTLDDSGLVEQLTRYRQLGSTALSIDERELGLVITFSTEVDLVLLSETIAIEQGCCSFLTLDYDASERRLSIAIDDPARGDALRALLSELADSTPPSSG